MATSLGALVVSLGLNAAEFVTGLTKAELEARRFKERLEKGVAAAGRAAAVGIGLITTAAVAAGVAVDQLVKEAARFKDLEEITGASAESLASFAVSAKVAGTDMNSVATASVKLTKGLTGVDDESKAAGAALAALGINIKEFKQLDPATQIESIAKALVGFQDGASKTAVALALFGKTGAELLPFLKELGDGIGRQTILTQAQIEAADKYADAQARATAQLHLYLQVAATEALKAIVPFTEALKDLIKELVGVGDEADKLKDSTAIEDFSTNAVKALGFIISSGEGLSRVFKVVGETIAAGAAQTALVATGNLKGAIEVGRSWQEQIDSILSKQLFSERLAARIKAEQDNQKFPGEGGGRRRERPVLNFAGPAAASARAGADRISEAQRFLDSLQKQIDKTLELTTLETALKEIQSGRLKGLTPAIESQIIATAKQIDAYKELQTWIDKTNKAFAEEVRALEAAAKERERDTKAAFDEAQSIADANRNLEDEIKIILGGDAARKQIERDRVQAAIDIKEQALAEALLNENMKGQADALALQIRFLKERQEKLGRRDFAEQLALDAKNFQDFKNIFADSSANALTDFITGTRTAKEAFSDFAKSVNAQIVKIASQNLANELFGGTNGQGFDFGKILSQLTGGALGGKGDSVGGFFSKLFGGGTSAAGAGAEATTALALTGSATALTASGGALTASSAAIDVSAAANTAAAGALTGAAAALTGAAGALAASSAASAASGLSGLFGSALSGMAQGGGLAGGTDNWRGGLTWVGEHGKELVNLPKGAQVIPNDVLMRGGSKSGVTNVFHINVPRGTSGPSADQIALLTGAAVQRALARNG